MNKYYLKTYIATFGVMSSFCFLPSITSKATPLRSTSRIFNALLRLGTSNESFVKRLGGGRAILTLDYSGNGSGRGIPVPPNSLVFIETKDGVKLTSTTTNEKSKNILLDSGSFIYYTKLSKNGQPYKTKVTVGSNSVTVTTLKKTIDGSTVKKVTKLTESSNKYPAGKVQQDIHMTPYQGNSLTHRSYQKLDLHNENNYTKYEETKTPVHFTSKYEDPNKLITTEKLPGFDYKNTLIKATGETQIQATNKFGSVVTTTKGGITTIHKFNTNGDLTKVSTKSPSGRSETIYNSSGAIESGYKITHH
ncbi:hypothetical protein [Candidatus Arthromitus sp. SFB-rat-Yit]|uniref:hypothetical protein n=1 Tax=Candidatus Arthromitus sp. SFB-rat-Yit TaxID=1041504 RepID=UPI000227A108|nr:hypothetical protein [Candidatus Arthromitus sp. SFB-rat-Yit]BAK81330.1 hypothetical protein RATSFB_0768 [Candidatus Arthromitus sp. SFB-rat-Yit]